MPKFKFAKLVRDKIVEGQIAAGAKPIYHLLSEDEHKRLLVEKVIEEAKELIRADPSEVAEEIADVQQALEDLAEKYGLTPRDIAKAQQVKRASLLTTWKWPKTILG